MESNLLKIEHMPVQKPILLADDSEDDEILFRRVLRLSGLANPVILVRDGDEAIAYLAGEGLNRTDWRYVGLAVHIPLRRQSVQARCSCI